MQHVDLEQFENANNWRVVHDPDNQLFYLKNDNGNRKPGFFTTRVFAEKALYDYLLDVTTKARESKAKEMAKRGIPGVDPRTGIPQGPRKKVLTPGKDKIKKEA